MKYVAFVISLFWTTIPSIAQEIQDATRITVRIIEEEGGERVVEERNYSLGALFPDQQREHLDNLLNLASKGEKGKNRRVSITLEEGSVKEDPGATRPGNNWAVTPDGNWFPAPEDIKVFRIDLERLSKRLDSSIANKTAKMEIKMNKALADLENRPGDFGFELNNRLEKIRAITFENGFSNSSKTVRSVSVSPNRPFDGHLNLRFTTREKGNVTIRVIDTNGKEQAKKDLKDFEGEFVGQIRLKDSAKGVLFVTVVQNDDGVSQRIALPSEDFEK